MGYPFKNVTLCVCLFAVTKFLSNGGECAPFPTSHVSNFFSFLAILLLFLIYLLSCKGTSGVLFTEKKSKTVDIYGCGCKRSWPFFSLNFALLSFFLSFFSLRCNAFHTLMGCHILTQEEGICKK